jgi:hypothetical protein
LTDSDWAADLDNRKSTGAYLFLLDSASCSWKVKLSPTVCLSTQQAEYYALSEGTKEALNLRFLLCDLGFGQTLPTMLFCDNKGAITMALHPANKPASRHIDMRIHFYSGIRKYRSRPLAWILHVIFPHQQPNSQIITSALCIPSGSSKSLQVSSEPYD